MTLGDLIGRVGALMFLMFLWVPRVVLSQEIQITSPVTGTTVAPGQTLSVTATVSGGSVVGVQIIGGDLGLTPFVSSAPYAFSLVVPAGTIGTRQLTAVGLIGNETIVTSSPVTVDVESTGTISVLSANPSTVSFEYAGQQLPLHVTAALSDGSTIDVTASSFLTFTTANPQVATVDHTGLITATGPGSTTISATYGAVSVSVQIAVPAYVQGDLDGDGVVTVQDMLILESLLGSIPLGPFDTRDLNGDGKIDSADLSLLLSLCGSACPTLAPTLTTVSSSPNPSGSGQTVTLTALVKSGSATPTGVVTFFDGGSELDIATLDTNGVAALSSATLPAGSHTFTAVYGGDSASAPSTSTATIQIVNPHMSGDVNQDGVVNCADLEIVKASFGLKRGQPGFDPRADVNGDGIVNVLDLAMVAKQLPVGTTCP